MQKKKILLGFKWAQYCDIFFAMFLGIRTPKNMANFEAVFTAFSANINLLFLKSDNKYTEINKKYAHI